MPVYRYRAVTARGSEVTGEVVAPSPAAARAQLSAQSLLPQDVSRRFSLPAAKHRLSSMLFFVQAFQSLLEAGLDVVEALEAASRHGSGTQKRVLDQVLADVKAGHSLADAFSRSDFPSDPLWLATLRAGEASGQLASAVAGYESHLVLVLELRRKVAATLTYPLVLAVAIALVLTVLFSVVIPRLQAGYASLGGELPLLTRMLVGAVAFAPWALLGATALAGLGMYWSRVRLSETDRWRLRNRLIDRLPLAGPVMGAMRTASIASTLSLLISASLPVHRALNLMASGERNRDVADRLDRAGVSVSEGRSLGEAFTREQLFPEAALHLLEIGERSGQLDSMLEKIAVFYKGGLESSIQRFASLVQPLLMLVIGLVIGLIVVAVYLPIFNLTQAIQ